MLQNGFLDVPEAISLSSLWFLYAMFSVHTNVFISHTNACYGVGTTLSLRHLRVYLAGGVKFNPESWSNDRN